MQRGNWIFLDEDTEYEMYEAAARILAEYGYEQYEISNYARKGRECRHNVGYWTRQIIWDLDWGQHLFMEISVSPIP